MTTLLNLTAACLFATALLAQDPTVDAASRPASLPRNTVVSFPEQTQLGNIFTAGEPVRIEARIASGEAIAWTITDFRGARVDSGTSPVKNGRVSISPHVTGNGYYLLNIGDAQTSYAVIPKLDLASVADVRFGVVTHFAKGMSTDILPLLVKGGILETRDENAWGQVEKTTGVFDFTGRDNHLINYMAELRRFGVSPLEVLAFGNQLHFDSPGVQAYQAAPYDQKGRDAYSNYSAAVLKQYGPQIKAVEIWNEYNGSFCAGPAAADRPRFYTEMLRNTYARIKSDRPDVTVVGGAMVNLPLPYAAKLFENGALQYMDAIAVHAYKRIPEGIEKQAADLVALMKKYNQGHAKPIWVTETGTWVDHSVERSASAGYLVRMYTLLMTQPEVARIYWYLLRDFEEFQFQGLVHSDTSPMGKYTPLACYPAYTNLIQRLHHAEFVGREPTDPRTRVYRFRRGSHSIFVAWSTSGATTLDFNAKSPLHLVDLVGGEKQPATANGTFQVPVDGFPIFIDSDDPSTRITETPRGDRVLADSADGFSDQQGKNNWSYHYYVSNKDGSATYNAANVQPMKWDVIPGDWGYRWARPGNSFQLSEEGASPSAVNGGQAWSVRRWTSDYNGAIHILGQAARENKKGDGVAVKVFVDGRELFNKLLTPGSSTEIDLNTVVKTGSRLDFVVTPGSGLDTSFDSTAFRAMILSAHVLNGRRKRP